jgi:hypothetical protein
MVDSPNLFPSRKIKKEKKDKNKWNKLRKDIKKKEN